MAHILSPGLGTGGGRQEAPWGSLATWSSWTSEPYVNETLPQRLSSRGWRGGGSSSEHWLLLQRSRVQLSVCNSSSRGSNAFLASGHQADKIHQMTTSFYMVGVGGLERWVSS